MRPSLPRTPARAGHTRRPWLRISRIQELVESGRHPNCSTLAREIEVTPKTIQRDICFMRDEMNLPLEYDDTRHGYHFTGPVGQRPPWRLSRADLMALFLARKALEPLRGSRLEKVLAQSFEKIAEGCPGEVSFQWRELDAAFSVKASGVVKADVHLFGDLMDAVLQRREIEFDYVKLAGRKLEHRRLRPFRVRQVDHGWYVTGYDLARKAERTFALPRISGLKLTNTKFERPDGVDRHDERQGGGFGVWTYSNEERKDYEVHLRFTGYAARVVAERQWHPSQQISRPSGGRDIVELRLKISGLEEITRWILSWGGKVRVLGPVALRKRVLGEARQLCRHLKG